MTTFPEIVANNKEKHFLKPGEDQASSLFFSEFGHQVQMAVNDLMIVN